MDGWIYEYGYMLGVHLCTLKRLNTLFLKSFEYAIAIFILFSLVFELSENNIAYFH